MVDVRRRKPEPDDPSPEYLDGMDASRCWICGDLMCSDCQDLDDGGVCAGCLWELEEEQEYWGFVSWEEEEVEEAL